MQQIEYLGFLDAGYRLQLHFAAGPKHVVFEVSHEALEDFYAIQLNVSVPDYIVSHLSSAVLKHLGLVEGDSSKTQPEKKILTLLALA